MTIDVMQAVPLSQWDDGSIRVRDTRLLIDMIIYAHKRGECPEEIFEAFPSDSYSVADIYSIVAYYLSNKKKIDRYLAKREKEAEKLWRTIEADPKHQVHKKQMRERMMAFKKERS